MEIQKKIQSKGKVPRKKSKDFRFFLQEQLETKCARNPNYSLRSFAKSLDVSPSALSALLNGKRPLTNKMMERLGLKLGLSIEELKKYKAKVHGNSKLVSEPLINDQFLQVTVDTFSIISEPHHYALLELIKTQGFRWSSKWIAQRLNKTVLEVNIAIERLERVGLLERDEEGNLFDTTNGFSTDIRDGLSSQAQRRFQERSLEQSISAVQNVPLELRDNTSMTMAINSEDMLEAKKMIKEFRRKFCTRMESSTNLNQVYQLTVSFIPVTNSEVVQNEK